jgi:hypothetical protein
MPAENRKKPRGRPFPPGNSANPGGRPKLPDDVKHVRELARQYTQDAVDAMVAVMANGSGPARVAAANALLDRAWGKAAQPVTGEGGEGSVQHTVTVKFE